MILLFKIIHIDKLTVYSSPDIIESSTHVLGLMTKVKRPIFENYFALNLSRFYKKIVFVSSNFYWNHQFSRKKRKSKHVHWSKAHVVSNFFVKHTRTKIIVSPSSRTHQVIWKMRAPKGTQSAHPQAYTAVCYKSITPNNSWEQIQERHAVLQQPTMRATQVFMNLVQKPVEHV